MHKPHLKNVNIFINFIIHSMLLAPTLETKMRQLWKQNRAIFGNGVQVWKRSCAIFGNKIMPSLETKSRHLWKQNCANFGNEITPSLEIRVQFVWLSN